jgi:hypothetical protein
LFEETAIEMGTAFLQLMTTMTDQSKKVMKYGREEKKSVIRIWTDDQKKLLSYLNADGWDVTNPGMSEKMKQLVEDKDPQRLRNVVDGWTQDWHGCVSYPHSTGPVHGDRAHVAPPAGRRFHPVHVQAHES